jgi:hypothetical protein
LAQKKAFVENVVINDNVGIGHPVPDGHDRRESREDHILLIKLRPIHKS